MQFLAQEFFHAVCVPFGDAQFFRDVPVVVQQLQDRIGAAHILDLQTPEKLGLVAPDESWNIQNTGSEKRRSRKTLHWFSLVRNGLKLQIGEDLDMVVAR